MQPRFLIPVLSVFFLAAHHDVARCWSRFELDLFVGTSKNFNAQLEVTQAGEPTLDFAASYESRSFEYPLYYAIRLAWQRETFGVELQLVHHKLYLSDPPAEIQQFEISHGLNLVTANFVVRSLSVDLRFGLGVVIAHPETIVRGLVGPKEGGVFNSEYHLTGPTFIAGAGHAFALVSRVFVIPEVFLSAARARVPVARGEAALFNVAFHAMVGVGIRF
jgi:hypothetical protein